MHIIILKYSTYARRLLFEQIGLLMHCFTYQIPISRHLPLKSFPFLRVFSPSRLNSKLISSYTELGGSNLGGPKLWDSLQEKVIRMSSRSQARFL